MLEKYSSKIKELKSFEKTDILNKEFELWKENNMEIYYAPHNEIVNKNAKIFIVGITPGWTQTSIAYKTAHDGLLKNLDYETIKKLCKQNSRFAGSMRKNIIAMLDELKINEYLETSSCEELFAEKDNLLHTTSVIPYPVFIGKKNYTGSNPKILQNKALFFYVKKYFYKEVKMIPNALYIPLGKAVEEVLEQMIEENVIKKEQCLLGFPHPSGANGHRKRQFEEKKEALLNQVSRYIQDN